ncbi:uncharacterized protein LOC130962869 [Arachis stenosperma]|uniref:uncharacterized protein LOC130962869 n=1 Tax=Arachis stenosperma TaxID=217475 RepID=UPI0025ACCF8D|nr:uncharacterized protein LOC130962869 [Arachis stenosperma]
MGPFSKSNGFVYIFLDVDYVSKWVEAIPTRCDDANIVASFLRNNIICKFGSPRAIVSDKGIHFCNRKIEVLMKKYEVLHKVFTAYHPQTNRQVEVSNREIKRILEKVVNPHKKGWSSRLGDALWAFRTAYKNPIRISPFRIVFGKPCHLPVEIQHKAYWAVKLCNPDLKGAGIECKLQLEELECLRLEAYENSKFYKEKAKTFHDQNIWRKSIKIGDEVLLYNSRLWLMPEKLRSRWDGPFKVVDVKPYRVVEVVHPINGTTFKINDHRVKPYHAQPKHAKELEIFLLGEDPNNQLTHASGT